MDNDPPATNRSVEAFSDARARSIIAALADQPGALLPILHAVQDAFGYIDPRVTPLIADTLNLSRAEVHGVISFYHDFRQAPAGRHVLQICRAEACQSMGVERLIERLERLHGLACGTTSPDNALTLEAVYCLGNCALSPAALLDGEPHGRLDDKAIDRIVKGAHA